jgi:hypothetical protein
MTYTFECPIPCNREIRVDAKNDEDAVTKLIGAGALCCRNAKFRCHCEKTGQNMSSLSEENIKQIVSMSMREACGKREEDIGILASA